MSDPRNSHGYPPDVYNGLPEAARSTPPGRPAPDPRVDYSRPPMPPDIDSGVPGRSRSATRATRREPVLREAVIVNASKGPTPQTATVRLQIPSSRLRVAVGVGWFAKGGAQPDLSASTVTLTPFLQDKSGDQAPMPDTVALNTLPFAENVDTTVPGYMLELALVRPAGTLQGALKVTARFEPTNEMSTEEWQSVQTECQVLLQSKAGMGISA